MYLRPVHTDLDPEICHAFVKANPLGLLITHLKSTDPSIAPIQASHIPFVIDGPSGGNEQTHDAPSCRISVNGRLRGHAARANPQVKAILAAAATRADSSAMVSVTGAFTMLLGSSTATKAPSTEVDTLSDDVLVIFTSPTHSYVTPTFYTVTKPTTHKVVPTWDYAAVQVYGKMRIYNKGDEATDYLQRQVEDLTNMEEEKLQAQCPGMAKWDVSMAPKSYVEQLKKGIVGIEIEISRIEGKFKMSQENDLGDWEGVVDGFNGLDTEHGKKMAAAVEERGRDRVRSPTAAPQIPPDGTDHQMSSASASEAIKQSL